MAEQDIALMAHLLRRAGFGASRDEIEARAAQGYDKTVDEYLNPGSIPGIEEDLLYRLQPSWYQAAAIESSVHQWVYRMNQQPSPTSREDVPLLAFDLLRRTRQDRQRTRDGPYGGDVPGARHG